MAKKELEKEITFLVKDITKPRNDISTIKGKMRTLEGNIKWAEKELLRFQSMVSSKSEELSALGQILNDSHKTLLVKEDHLKVKRLALTKICRKKDSLILSRKQDPSKSKHASNMSAMMKDI